MGACLTYADGSAGPFEYDGVPMTGPKTGYAVSGSGSDGTDGFDKTVGIFLCRDIDLEKEIKVEFYSGERGGHSGALEYFVNRKLSDDFVNELEGLEFTASFAQNVDLVKLQNSDGECISMSSFEVYSDDPTLFDPVDASFAENFFLITNDGEKKPLDQGKFNAGRGTDYAYVLYGEFIDVSEYKGVEINGTEYLK